MMSFVLFLLLRIGSGPSFDVFADAAESSPELPRPFDSVAPGEFSEDGPAEEPPAWTPETALRVDRDGANGSGPPSDSAEALIQEAAPAMSDSLVENSPGPGPFCRSAIRAILEPLDLLCRWENVRAACEKGFPDLSVVTSLPGWIDSWGCALGTHSLLCVSFDILGFEELQGSDPVILDPKHGTARLSYVSTAISFSLKF